MSTRYYREITGLQMKVGQSPSFAALALGLRTSQLNAIGPYFCNS